MADISAFDLKGKPDLRGFTLGFEMRFQEQPVRAFLPSSDTPLAEEPQALTREVLVVNSMLKRSHPAYYKENQKEFRKTVTNAQRRSFRVKPGPKRDTAKRHALQKAARERGRGADWKDLYPIHIPGYAEISEFTRGQAEDTFRRTVNKYLRDHPRLKKSPKKARRVPTIAPQPVG